MLGIEGYDSGSDNDSDSTQPIPKADGSHPPKPASERSLPPSNSKRAPKRITIGLPSLPSLTTDEDYNNDERPAKRPRIEASAGRSSLLSMLPAPKGKALVAAAPEKVLGGGKAASLVFRSAKKEDVHSDYDSANGMEEPVQLDSSEEPQEHLVQLSAAPPPFVPSSLRKGRSNISVEEETSKSKSQSNVRKPTVDFFSLGQTSSPPNLFSSTAPGFSSTLSPAAISSAPEIPTFQPPEPSQTDEYPGYYKSPSGTWAAHDPAYYAEFLKKWQAEYDAHVRALEKGMAKGFEGLDSGRLEEVNAQEEMERAKREIKEREDRKAITLGAGSTPAQPKMKITASKTSGIARSRHQLATLLKEAYENREALEEKIAQGRRNRKEAGNKYAPFDSITPKPVSAPYEAAYVPRPQESAPRGPNQISKMSMLDSY